MLGEDEGDSAMHEGFDLTRREGLTSILPGFLLFALLGEAVAAPMPGRRASGMSRWVDEQDTIARDLASGRIDGRAWAAGVRRLATTIDVEEVMAHLDKAQVTAGGKPNHNDPSKRYVKFLDAEGRPRRLGYGVALFDFEPQNVITPHGHRHMVSAHMVVAGAFRVRNFNRVGDEDGAMVIRPTRDYVARVGQVSTMCSQEDNIHWFVPQGQPGTTFDVVISGLDPGKPDYDIKTIDPVNGRRRPDGTIVAPVIGFDESARRYTSAV
jgi:hypothetical protein